MAHYQILKSVNLSTHHQPTGNTKHYKIVSRDLKERVELPAPSKLLIAQFPGDSGYYLLYLDEYGEELTDTYHESVEKAIAQAKFEFNILPEEWENREIKK
jgi:hypothetical protein